MKQYTLRNGEKGWPFSRIFDAEYLRGVAEVWLIDPYFAQPHQRRNLRELLEAVTSTARPKTVNVMPREILDLGAGDER